VENELHYEETFELRKVAMRRVELKTNNIKAAESKSTAVVPYQGSESKSMPKEAHSGVMAWLFPSWNGSQTAINKESHTGLTDIGDSGDRDSALPLVAKPSEVEFEDAILDDVKAFEKDSLLASFKFVLRQGKVNLTRKNESFLGEENQYTFTRKIKELTILDVLYLASVLFSELDFRGVELKADIKPKSGSHKFRMTLSTLSLKDCSTKSDVVGPHSEGAKLPRVGLIDKNEVEPLFNFQYEHKPHKKAGHRISVTTKPIDILLNPTLLEEVRKYFSLNIPEGLFVYYTIFCSALLRENK